MKRFIAGALAGALILTAPGILPYAAAADVVNGAPGAIVRPIQIGTSQLNVLKGAGPLPTSPGALGLDPTQRSIPDVPVLPAPAPGSVTPAAQPAQAQLPQAVATPNTPNAPDATPAQPSADPLAPVAKGIESGLHSIAKPGASGEASARAGEDITSVLQGGIGHETSGDAVPVPDGSAANGLAPHGGQADGKSGSSVPPSSPANPSTKSGSGKFRGFLITAARVVGAAAAVVGIQALLVLAAPALFGAVPVAAVWAIGSGVFILPAALYTRYRLSKHDTPALNKVKLVLDIAIGAFIGATVIAAPAFSMALVSQMATASLPMGIATTAVSFLSMIGGGKAMDILATGGVLAGLPLIMGIGAAGAIAVGPLLGMLALPVMTTLSFFLGSIVRSAETGRPFSIPGSLQKVRFPAFNWVMMGVVFALTSGYGAVFTNIAFAAWTLFGDKGNKDKDASAGGSLGEQLVLKLAVAILGPRLAEKLFKSKAYAVAKKVLGVVLNFNVLYAAVFVIAAASGFASPLTFLVLAFAPERAAHWTERLLRKLYPGGKAAPSTAQGATEDTQSYAERLAAKSPRFYHWAKTFAILAVMLGAGFAMGAGVFGFAALFKNLLIAAAIATPQLIFSRWMVKKLMRAEPASPENMPKHFQVYSEVVGEVQGLVNAQRAAKGKKPIPAPEKVRVPLDLPNAFATGPSPFHATIGVTDGIMDMLLDPQNAREGLIRLIESVSKEPQGKPYLVFRKAIAGSVAGVNADAAPQEIQQALLRAGDDQIQALGKRMLRGVLGHEFSHVTDRHMLTGAIAGAFSSGIAFASYGVMWGVGHAKAVLKRAVGRAEPPAPAASGARVESVGLDAAKIPEGRSELLDPVSAGVAMKSLPAILRVFAALWGPTILQIIQMAGSRNNESQADKDGAYLTDDPESLALALGMLTTWKPRPGFAFPWAQMPRLAALSQFMTVDPMAQLRQANALPKDDALPQWAASKSDDWMFNLWVTHPDTRQRIEVLHDIAESLHRQGAQDFRPQPPPADPNKDPSFVPSPAPGGRAGFFRKMWTKLKDFIQVLPDKVRNREFWKFVWGQALVNLGFNFHYTALPKLVDPNDNQPQRVMYNRAVNAGSQLVSSLATGAAVDRYSVQKILVWTYLGRTLLLLSVPILFHFGLLSFMAFQIFMFGMGFIQSLSMTASSVAFNRILAQDTAYYNKANAVFNLIVSLVGIAGPLMAGSFIVLVDSHFGALSGNAYAYGVFGLLMAGALLIYRKLHIPRDELLQARHDLWDSLKKGRESFWRRARAALVSFALAVGSVFGGHRAAMKPGEYRITSVSAARVNGQPTLVVDVKGDLSAVKDVPKEFSGYPVKIESARSVVRELLDGFKLIWKDHFLKIYVLFGTVSALMADPIVFSAIPRYIDGILKTPAAQQGGVFGLYMAATGLGTGLASFAMMLLRDKAGSEFEAELASAKAKIAAQDGLGDDKAEAALEAVRAAQATVLERYRDHWKSDPAWEASAPAFQQDLLEETSARINAAVFAGAKTRPDLVKFMADTGLGQNLWSWAQKHFTTVTKDARKQAKTGLTGMERQGRWSSWLNGLGWLLYWGVFFIPGLHWSLAAIIIASMLQAPAMAVWSTLVQSVLGKRHPENMGKIYAAINFYTLVFAILGPILFTPLLKMLPLVWVLVVACGAITVMAVLDIIQPSKSFPIDRSSGHGPKT